MTGEKIKFVLGLIAGVLVGACAPKLEVNEMVNVQVPQLKHLQEIKSKSF